MSTRGVSSFGESQALAKVIDYVRLLPEEDFVKNDLDIDVPLRRLRHAGAVEIVGSTTTTYDCEDGEKTSHDTRQYAVTDEAWDELERIDEDGHGYTPCPCGHSGLENHGDHYECMFELCDREFARDELEVDR